MHASITSPPASQMTKSTTMTSKSRVTLTKATSPLLLLVLLLLSHVHSSSSSPVIRKRQSFFRCTGWGAGCSNLDYAPYLRDVPRRGEQQLAVARSGQKVKTSSSAPSSSSSSIPPASSSSSSASPSRGSRNGYGLHFLFTSGTSWGANGKRSSASSPGLHSDHQNNFRNIIDFLLREMQNRQETVQR